MLLKWTEIKYITRFDDLYCHISAQQRLHFSSSCKQLPRCLSAGLCPISCCVAVTSPIVGYNNISPNISVTVTCNTSHISHRVLWFRKTFFSI